MKDKALIFVPYMTGFGGTEHVITNLFNEYNKKERKPKIPLKLISLGGYKDDNWIKEIKDKNVLQLNKNKYIRKVEYLATLPFLLLHYVLTNKPTIVISTNPIMWTILGLLKNIFNFKYKIVAWYHYSLDAHPLSKNKLINKLYLKYPDIFLAISSGIAKQLEKQGIASNKIKVIYNPINRSSHTIKPTLKNNPTKFIYVGRLMLDGQKNLREVLRAVDGLNGNWKLDIYGAGNKSEVEKYIKNMKHREQIELKGFDPKLWDKISYADTLILSSKFEGLPMVLNEAISHGLPVISSNCYTGPNDIVCEDNGKLYELGNVKDLRNNLFNFLNNKNSYSSDKIKASINKFYSENYFKSFMHAITN